MVAVPALGDDSPGEAGGLEGPFEGARAEALTEVMEKGEERAEAFEDWLEGPAATTEREASQSAYEEETRAGAEDVLKEQFAPNLEELDADPGRLVTTTPVQEVYALNAARVGDGESGSAILQSTMPIAEQAADGSYQPLDLRLEPDGQGFVAADSLVNVRLPGTAGGEVVVGEVAIDELPGDGHPAASRLGDMSLFYPETDTDTDTLIAPIAGGVEIFSQLRSPQSPERLTFGLQLPPGATLTPAEGGAEVRREGEKLLEIPAPSAVDAQGVDVPVGFTIEGGSLVLDVAHRGADLAYPILVDPGPKLQDLGAWASWGWEQLGSTEYPHSIGSTDVHIYSKGEEVFYAAGSNGHYYMQPPGATSYVSRVAFSGLSGSTGTGTGCVTNQPHGWVGIARTDGGFAWIKEFVPISTAAGGYESGWAGGLNSRWAVIGVGTPVNSKLKCAHQLHVGAASVWTDDPDWPSLGSVSAPGTVGQNTASVSVSGASDSGLGLSTVQVQIQDAAHNFILNANGNPRTWAVAPSGNEDCGYIDRPCSPSWWGSIAFSPTYMTGTSGYLVVSAIDAVGHTTTQTYPVTVDHTAPETIIDSGPANLSAQPLESTPAYTFHASESPASFECQWEESGTYGVCSSGYKTPKLTAGKHILRIRAADSLGNKQTVGSTRVLYGGPPDTTIVAEPSSPTNDPTLSFEYTSTQEGAGFECRVDGAAFSACSQGGFTSSTLADGSHTFEVRAVNTGLYDQTPASRSFIVDTTPPTIDIVGGPTGPTNQTKPKFTFTKEAGAVATCSVDTGSQNFGTCSGATTHSVSSSLSQQTYIFRVHEEDAAENPTTATRAFTVDTVAPQTTIESGPQGPTRDATPRFELSSSEEEAGYDCRVDAQATEPCDGNPVVTEVLDDGQHTLRVSAEDEAGNVDPTPASRTFNVDTTKPGATITGPSGAIADQKPIFGFSVDASVSVKCGIYSDQGGGQVEPRACSGPTSDTSATALADGGYTFQLFLTDAANNENTVERHFIIDTAPPDTSITAGPEGATDEPQPIFGFAASEAKAKYECKVDAAEFAPCSGPGPTHTPAAPLADGEHTFAVRAVDQAGSVDPSPAVTNYKVDTQKPQTSIISGPSGPTPSSTPSFSYSSSESATFQCRIDSSSFSACPNAGLTIPSAAEGQHTLAVRAVDSVENSDPTPAKRSFVVDTSTPTTPILSGDAIDPETAGVGLDLEINDGSSASLSSLRSGVEEVTVKIDGAVVYRDQMPCVRAFQTCPDHLTRELELPIEGVVGTHTYSVQGADAVGHKSVIKEVTATSSAEPTTMPREKDAAGSGCEGPLDPYPVNKDETTVHGTGHNDLIVSKPWVKTILGNGGCDKIVGSFGAEKIYGGAGKDLIRGSRSNDELFGNDGEDEIIGGIGDDLMEGDGDGDFLDGGPGSDHEYGGPGNDSIHGGQGVDYLLGQAGASDTLSFADAVGPSLLGGSDFVADVAGVTGFPGKDDATQRGVYVNLGASENRDYAINGKAEQGGGRDFLYLPQDDEDGKIAGDAKVHVPGAFERVIGSPFADVIRGSGDPWKEEIWGGPGPDILHAGGGGPDVLNGGLDGDYLDGSNSASKLAGGEGSADENRCANFGGQPISCLSTSDQVSFANADKLVVGVQEPDKNDPDSHASVYVDGSPKRDVVKVKFPTENTNIVQFEINSEAPIVTKHCPLSGGVYTCALGGEELGAVVILGDSENDELTAFNLLDRRSGSIELLGGPGHDQIEGNGSDELLLDGGAQGGGNEVLHAGAGDDVVIQGEGQDHTEGDDGNDLLMSAGICESDELIGGGGSDNAQFHPLAGRGVWANLTTEKIGDNGVKDNLCPGHGREPLRGIEDLEGSPQSDYFTGDAGKNLLIGRGDPDVLMAEGGNDTINAKDEARDKVISCGGQEGDLARIDKGNDENPLVPGLASCIPSDPKKQKNYEYGGKAYPSRVELLDLRTFALPAPSGEVENTEVAGEEVPPPLVAAYPLDDSGAQVENAVEDAGDGSYGNADVPQGNESGPTKEVEGAFSGEVDNEAVELDGTNDFIELGEEPEPLFSPYGYSIEMWVQFEEDPGEKEYVFSAMEEGEGPFIYRNPEGELVFGVHTEEGTPEVTTTDPIDDGHWHQIVGTLEGEEIGLYVDGFPHRMGYGQPVLPEAPIEADEVIGANNGMNYFLEGTVDEVLVYEGALEEADVIQDLVSSDAEEPETLLAPPIDTEDTDGDQVVDAYDNCVNVDNTDQADENTDGVGDACLPPDGEGDGTPNEEDNCPSIFNVEQIDRDEDGAGAECDPDEPVLKEEAATNVTATAVTLNGRINPEGLETTYWFEYGESSSYGAKVPASPKSIGTRTVLSTASETLRNLKPGTIYHYRLLASVEGAPPVAGEDQTFETKTSDIAAKLAGMPVTEPLDATSATSFASNWATLGWAGGSTPKGAVESSGWHPVDAFSTVNGAYYNQMLSDSGWGVGTATTMATNPANASRYLSLWLDLPSPSSATRAGYELRFTYVSANTYNVTLSKWVGGAQTELATKAGYTFANGNSFALVDLGNTVSAWTDTGGGYSQLLSAADSTYEGGKTGLEGSGNITRLVKFKAGALVFPKVTTEAANEVKGTSATLNATVDPEGSPTTYQFEFGTNTAYGEKVPVVSRALGSGAATPVNEQLGGLQPGTTYHYRAVATNEGGTVYGADRTLTTLRAPKAETGGASGLSGSGATLNGLVDPEGSETTYLFEYGSTTEYGESIPVPLAVAGTASGGVAVSQPLSGLEAGATYHYRLVASSEGGTTYGEDRTLTTLKLPKATTNAASSVKAASAVLNALVNPEGTATTYQFEYGPTAAYGSKAPVTPGSAGAGTTATAVSGSISGLTQNTSYHYRVVATSAAGTSYGEDRTLTTLKLPQATTGTVTNMKATTATISASINPEGSFTTYQFEYGLTTSYGLKVPASSGFAGLGSSFVEVSQTATSLSPGSTYHYRVIATSAAGTAYGEDKTFAVASFETGAQLPNLPVAEPFDGSGTSVANFGSGWAALGWAGGSTPKGADEASGWRPVDAYSTVNGAYYNQTLNDLGWGVGTAATLANNPEIEARYFSLWLDMPSPTATTRAGYELRFTNTAANLYTVALSKWVGGTQTQLASKTAYTFVNGNSFALVDMGGTVSAWTNTGSGYAQLLSAADTTYEGGKAGVEGSGNITRLTNFRASQLKLLPKAITEAATNVKMGQATLNASVNPQGTSTTYQIEYGTSVAYGSKVPTSPAGVGSGNSPVAVTQTITALEAGTTYHYRVVATSEAGTAYGEDKTATTPAAPSYLTSFGTAGTSNGQFAHPAGIAIDGAGNAWVVDENNARVEKFGPSGEYLTKFGSTGSGDGQFNRPTDVAIDPKGNLWVTDAGNNRVQKFSPGGEFLAKFGSLGNGNGQFSGPESLAVDSKGNVWVADTYNGRVQKFSETGEFLKVVGSPGTGQGQIVEATGIDIGLGGTVWVADWGNQKVLEFSETGEFIRQFGSEGTGNGQFKRPDVIEVDSKGRVWVGDQNNARIQRFTETGTYMSQFGTAGSGAGQFSFGWPMGIASDGSGNLWIADTGNNRVQKWG